MRVLFVTDPLAGLQPEVDATVGLMLATQSMGGEVWVCGPEELSIVDGRPRARARQVQLRPAVPRGDHRWVVESTWWDQVDHAVLDLTADAALVQLRIDPPVDARYLHTTYLLDLVEASGVRVVNRPEGVRALHEKLVALHYPQLCPETIVDADPRALRDFVARVGTAVVKPVDGFAGMDVWLVRDDPGATALVESATRAGTRHVIAQAYLADVASGNKRLFVLDGEVIGAVLRRPDRDDFRIGPPVAVAEIDGDDRRIMAQLGPALVRHGISLAGIDVIAGRLIEVNVTCPGGMHKTDALLGTDLSGAIMRRLLHHERVLR
ncbi:MAG: glutathione synthase [Actinomycetota bacterium]|nr:glutathione synthase [Actinomycetota bacterium]